MKWRAARKVHLASHGTHHTNHKTGDRQRPHCNKQIDNLCKRVARCWANVGNADANEVANAVLGEAEIAPVSAWSNMELGVSMVTYM